MIRSRVRTWKGSLFWSWKPALLLLSEHSLPPPYVPPPPRPPPLSAAYTSRTRFPLHNVWSLMRSGEFQSDRAERWERGEGKEEERGVEPAPLGPRWNSRHSAIDRLGLQKRDRAVKCSTWQWAASRSFISFSTKALLGWNLEIPHQKKGGFMGKLFAQNAWMVRLESLDGFFKSSG